MGWLQYNKIWKIHCTQRFWSKINACCCGISCDNKVLYFIVVGARWSKKVTHKPPRAPHSSLELHGAPWVSSFRSSEQLLVIEELLSQQRPAHSHCGFQVYPTFWKHERTLRKHYRQSVYVTHLIIVIIIIGRVDFSFNHGTSHHTFLW